MSRAQRIAIGVVAVLIFVTATAGGTYLYAQHRFSRIPTFDQVQPANTVPPAPKEGIPAPPPAPPTTLKLPKAEGVTTYLLFSVGAQGVEKSEAERLRIGKDRLDDSDGLTDTMIIVIVDATNNEIRGVSIPRDTWLADENMKLNAVYNTKGAQALSEKITELTGIPINHMLSINFTGFADIIDAIGGVKVTVPQDMRDKGSGLNLKAGCVTLDGADAIAIARGRKVEYNNGAGWKHDPTGDFGRIERTQQLLAAIAAQTPTTKLVTLTSTLFDIAEKNVVRDSGFGLDQALELAEAFRTGGHLSFYSPPAHPAWRGKASVVMWDETPDPELVELSEAVKAGSLLGHSFKTDSAPTGPGMPTTNTSTTAAPVNPTPDEPAIQADTPTGVAGTAPITAGCV